MKRFRVLILFACLASACLMTDAQVKVVVDEKGEFVVSAKKIPVDNGYDRKYDPSYGFVIDRIVRIMTWQEKLLPDNYIAGYAMQPNSLTFPEFGIFLVKDRLGYKLVLNWADRLSDEGKIHTDRIRIGKELARKLEAVVQGNIGGAPVEPDDYHSAAIYDGSHLLALMPGASADRWSDEIPDRLWNEQLHRFEDRLKNGFTYIAQNLPIYRDSETHDIIIHNSYVWRYGGHLVIPECEEHDYEVVGIEDNAFKYLKSLRYITLESVVPIACQENVFDESVYENAILRVPKGWTQKKAAKVGPAWGRFKNIRYY